MHSSPDGGVSLLILSHLDKVAAYFRASTDKFVPFKLDYFSKALAHFLKY